MANEYVEKLRRHTMKYLITLSLTVLSMYILIKKVYKQASIQDTVEAPLDYFKGGEN